MIWSTIQLFFAGAWHYIFHWGTGVGLIVLALFMAYAPAAMLGSIPVIGPWLAKMEEPLRHDLVVFAFGVAVFMAGMWLGDRDGAARCVAKEKVVVQTIDRVVVKSNTPAARKAADPYDSPDN